MKIFICGTFVFAKQMQEVSKKLAERGHEVLIPFDTELAIQDSSISQNVERCIKNDIFRKQLSEIITCEAILVLNYDNEGIKGYIGGSTLIEMAFAYYYRMKIFLLNPIPEMSYKPEIQIMQPTILFGKLELLK